MRKITLITIICFLIPCFGYAQEPNSLLGIDNTLWQVLIKDPDTGDFIAWSSLGFYDEKVYFVYPEGECHRDPGEEEFICSSMYEESNYVDLLLFSFFSIDVGYDWEENMATGYLFPLLGIGFFISPQYKFAPMTKSQDDWTPDQYE